MGRQKYETKQWAKLKAMHAKHPEWKLKEMAAALNSTTSRLYSVTRNHSFEIDLRIRQNSPRLEDPDKEDIVRMYMDGNSMQSIAEYIGIAYATVRYHLMESGVIAPRMRKPRNLMRNLQIAELTAQGMKDRDIADKTGYTRPQLSAYKNRIRRGRTGMTWWQIYEELKAEKERIDHIINITKQEDNDQSTIQKAG